MAVSSVYVSVVLANAAGMQTLDLSLLLFKFKGIEPKKHPIFRKKKLLSLKHINSFRRKEKKRLLYNVFMKKVLKLHNPVYIAVCT